MPGETEIATVTPAGHLELRRGGLRVHWEFADLRTADGMVAEGRFSCMVRALEDPVEKKMLREALLGTRAAVSARDLSEHFSDAIHSAATRLALRHSVESLLAEAGREDLRAGILTAAKSVAFVSGVEILPPMTLEVECPEVRRKADRAGRMREAAELFEQFQKLREAGPGLSAGEILNRIGAADQGEILRAGFMQGAQAAKSKRLWAVAGNVLFQIPEELENGAGAIPVPGELGPVRSVRGDGVGGLLLGCRGGVIRLLADSKEGAGIFADGKAGSQSGFNAAGISGNKLWATHTEMGLAWWELDGGGLVGGHAQVLPGKARNLCVLESGEVIFSAGARIGTGSGEFLGSERDSEIMGLFVLGKRVLAARVDGRISILDGGSLKTIGERHGAGRVSAAGIVPWMGETRILLAEESGGIVCVGVEDEVCTQYASGHVGSRMVAGSAQRVAAVSADRQRLIVWNSWDGKTPLGEIHLGSLAGHRVADIGFV